MTLSSPFHGAAFAGKMKGATSSAALQYDYRRGLPWMLLLMLQFAVQPLVTQLLSGDYARRDPTINPRIMVMITEGLKIFISLAGLYSTSTLSSSLRGLSYETSVLPAFIPAISYSLQNILIYLAYLSLDPVVANLLNPTKVAFTVLFTYFILGRQTNRRELVAVSLLFCAVVVLRSESDSKTSSGGPGNIFTFGFVYALGAAFLSGFGSAMCERSMLIVPKITKSPSSASSGTSSGSKAATTSRGRSRTPNSSKSRKSGGQTGNKSKTPASGKSKSPAASPKQMSARKRNSSAVAAIDTNIDDAAEMDGDEDLGAGAGDTPAPKQSANAIDLLEKGKKSAYLFSLELSCATFCLTGFQVAAVYAYDFAFVAPPERTALLPAVAIHVPELLTCVPLILQASGGIVVGQVTKYVGGVAKGFTIVCGIVLTAVLNALVNREYPTPRLLGAVGLVVASLYLQATATATKQAVPPPVGNKKKQ